MKYKCQNDGAVLKESVFSHMEETETREIVDFDENQHPEGAVQAVMTFFVKKRIMKTIDMIVTENTIGEARNVFKKKHGVKPDHCTGPRLRLPIGFRVREISYVDSKKINKEIIAARQAERKEVVLARRKK